jgi:hypothetical protein
MRKTNCARRMTANDPRVMWRCTDMPLPILIHLGSPRFRSALLTLIVHLAAPLPNRLQQPCRVLWAQFLLCCRLLSGRWHVVLGGVLRLCRLLVCLFLRRSLRWLAWLLVWCLRLRLGPLLLLALVLRLSVLLLSVLLLLLLLWWPLLLLLELVQ